MRKPAPLAALALAAALSGVACGSSVPTGPELEDGVTLRGAGRHALMVQLPSGDTLRYTLYVPPGASASDPVPLVLAAHFGGVVTPWLGGSFADLLVVPGFRDLPALIVAPDAGSPGGWSASDEEGVLWLVERLLEVYPVDAERVVVTGYSAGGGQTWMWANRHQALFSAAIPVSARPRPTENSWTIPVHVIHSSDDELIPLADVEDYVREQQAAGASFELTVVSGIGHYETDRFVPALREAVAWLGEVWR
jgi:predicted peptidase